MTDTFEVVVNAITEEARGIRSLELRRPDGAALPPFTAGAHIDLHLGNGIVRSYSLCNAQQDRDRYVVAVGLDPKSRGGSKFIHDRLRPGDRIEISTPRNNFPLAETARHVVFIAGGIGITPLFCMIQRLEDLGRSWELHYSAREPQTCAFRDRLDDLEAGLPGRVHLNFDHVTGGRPTDLAALIAATRLDAHLYCCGPAPMLQAFEAAAKDASRPDAQVHVEYFSAKEAAAVEGGFDVVLARTGRTFPVLPGRSILDVLLEQGVDVPHSCTEGVCGTCEVKVLEGIPDHRDSILSPQEQAANKTMFVCCSGSKTSRLVLDL